MLDAVSYLPKKQSRSEFLTLRSKRYHLRHWGESSAPLLVFLHGWMDISATHQFVVDALQKEWHIVAPDWSGYGGSDAREGAFYLTEYLADLDALLEQISPSQPASLVAHSMGANIATMYAGARPERVNYLVNMEGLGPLPSMMAHPTEMLSRWLASQRKEKRTVSYSSVQAFADRLIESNDRLPMPRALFLAKHFVTEKNNGGVELLADSSARAYLPMFPHIDQVVDMWSRITAKVLFLRGDESVITLAYKQDIDTMQRRMNAVSYREEIEFRGVSHNMHHEIPELIAKEIENFLR